MGLQGATGCWPVSLPRAAADSRDQSGTGFFRLVASAWGIHHGLLPPQKRLSAFRRSRLARSFAAAGATGPASSAGCRRIGEGPDRVTADDTQLYGVGDSPAGSRRGVRTSTPAPPHRSPVAMNAGRPDTQKLYQQIARTIAAAVEDGRYAPGDKLPSERELAEDFGVSRPTIRDAMIALEFQGLVEARQSSGVYVKAASQICEDASERDVSALELAEARRLFEGEACALAASPSSPTSSVALLDGLVADMARDSAAEEF